MSIQSSTQIDIQQGEFVQALVSVLKRLRRASDGEFRAMYYGMALGYASLAFRLGLIGWAQYERLSDLAMNAADYAQREARHA